MATYEFNGNWYFRYRFPLLAKFEEDLGESAYGGKSDGWVKIMLDHDLSDATDPVPEQVAAFRWILNNEKEFLERCFYILRDQVYPLWTTYQDDCPDDFPELTKPADIRKVFTFDEIEIGMIPFQGKVFLTINSESTIDREHGTSLLIYEHTLVDRNGRGEIGPEKLHEFIGEPINSYNDWSNAAHEKREAGPKPPFRPDEKYGVIKPGRARENYDLLRNLIRNDNFEEFRDTMKIYDIDPDHLYVDYSERMVDVALGHGNLKFIKFFVDAGVDLSSAFQTISLKAPDADLVDYLINQGADVNGARQSGKTLLAHHLREMVSAAMRIGYSKPEEEDKRNKLEVSIKHHQRMIDFWLAKGTDAANADGKGNNLLYVYNHCGWNERAMAELPYGNWVATRTHKPGKEELPEKPWYKFW